ncbi:hypothetical protein [Bradyrhizobium cenepequi]
MTNSDNFDVAMLLGLEPNDGNRTIWNLQLFARACNQIAANDELIDRKLTGCERIRSSAVGHVDFVQPEWGTALNLLLSDVPKS